MAEGRAVKVERSTARGHVASNTLTASPGAIAWARPNCLCPSPLGRQAARFLAERAADRPTTTSTARLRLTNWTRVHSFHPQILPKTPNVKSEDATPSAFLERQLRRLAHPEVPEDVWTGFEEAEEGRGTEILDAHFEQPPS